MLYKDDWDEVKHRLLAWWDCEVVDRAVVQVTAPRDHPLPATRPPEADVEQARIDPDVVIAQNEYRFARTWFGGEAFPNVFINLGPGIAGTYLGGDAVIDESTVWYPRSHDSVDEIPDLAFDRDSRWWRITEDLTRESARRGEGEVVHLHHRHRGRRRPDRQPHRHGPAALRPA
jgi:5-methyltetrahydrofolate--homocysteine methyltransferase